MKVLILLSLFGMALSRTVPQCHVGDWGEWSACKGKCPLLPGKSEPAGPPQVFDEGRILMKFMMEEKRKQRDTFWDCVADGSCPGLAAFTPKNGAAPCVEGEADDYPCRNIHKLDFLDFEALGTDASAEGNDIWGWTDTVEDEDYAIVGTTHGTGFVRITQGINVEPLGFMNSHNNIESTWRDMKVVNDHAYIVSEAAGHGLQVFDLTQLRGLTADSYRVFIPDQHYGEFGNAHNIAVNVETETLFVIGATTTGNDWKPCAGGLHMIDVSDPREPRFDGCYAEDGYSHDVECVIYRGPDERFTGNEICFGYNENTLTIVDVTDHGNPEMLARVGYEGSRYTHQGWLSTNQRWALLDDELDEILSLDKKTKTYVWDVASLTDPTLSYVYQSPENSVDHNMYIYARENGDWVFQSNYESGLRLLHLDGEKGVLTEYGYFDVLPDQTTANFAGTWSNYPYLRNGAVAMTSIEYGFFMVQPDWEVIDAEVAAKKAYGERERFRSIHTFDEGSVCPRLRQVEMCDEVQC